MERSNINQGYQKREDCFRFERIKMERKCKRESFGGVFEDSETPRRKRLRVEYLDETSSLDILIEDLSANQSPSPEETSCKQALPMVTPRKRSTIGRFPTPCRDKDAIIYNRRSSAKQSKFSTCSEPKYDGEVDKVLMRMKDCFEEVSKLLKAKDNENKMLKRSTTRTQGEEQLNPEEGESFSSRLKEELEDLKRQKEHWDENQNRLRNENKKLRDELEKKTADIENNLLEMVGQSKEMNSLRGQIRTLEEEKKRRKNEEKSGKVWACISVKPLSQLISNEQAAPSNSEATEERSDLDDVVIPMKVVDDDLGSIVHEEEGDVATNSISQTGEDARDSAQEEPAFAMPVEAVGERIKSEKEADLPEVVIDKVVPGKELVKIENPEVAAIDEALDEEEKEVEELQRILDQEEEEARQKEAEMVRQKEKQMNFDQEKEEETRRKEAEERQENFKQKDSECQSEGQRYWEEEGGSMVERCPEKEKRLEKDASLEKEVQQEKEKENDCAAEKENSLLNKSANGSMLDEGGREENESEDEFVDLLEEEDFEDVEEDEDDVEELDTSGVLEEVERELDILEERQVRPTSQIRSSTEKETCQSEIERPIVIQGEEELLQEDVGDDLLQEVGGDHLVSGWVELKEHALTCSGVEELYEKEELAVKRQSRALSRIARGGAGKRSEVAAEERQKLVNESLFFKHRPREVNVFNGNKEGLQRKIQSYICPRLLLVFRSKVSAFYYIQWKGETSERDLKELADKLRLRQNVNLNKTL